MIEGTGERSMFVSNLVLVQNTCLDNKENVLSGAEKPISVGTQLGEAALSPKAICGRGSLLSEIPKTLSQKIRHCPLISTCTHMYEHIRIYMYPPPVYMHACLGACTYYIKE